MKLPFNLGHIEVKKSSDIKQIISEDNKAETKNLSYFLANPLEGEEPYFAALDDEADYF